MFKSEVFKSWTLVLQLGISMIVPILMLVALASFIRDSFGIDLMLALIVFGLFVGIRNVYSILKNYLDTIDRDRNKESELLKKHLKSIG